MSLCTHRLEDATDGLLCTREQHEGTGHTYSASSAPDLHDQSEQRAEADRG